MGKSGSEGRGEQTTARKRGIGGSPLTLLPESQSPEDAMFHPPERRPKPVPPPALARHAGERTPGRRSDSQ